MRTNISLPRAFFELHLFVSNDQYRGNIGQLRIEVANGKAIAIATDGHRMLTVEHDVSEQDYAWPVGKALHITRKDAAEICKTFRKSEGVQIYQTDDSVVCRVTANGVEMLLADDFAPLEGMDTRFPDWRQVMNGRSDCAVPTAPFSLNAEYVGDLAKYSKKLGQKGPGLAWNFYSVDEISPVLLKPNAPIPRLDVCAVIMPVTM